MKFHVQNALVLLALFAGVHQAGAQGTAFTYQGRLSSGGNPASGLYDFRFKLYSDALGNTQVGGNSVANAVPTANGLFIVAVDFGAGVFTGGNYWLEVDVKTNGAAAYTVLSPLQAVTPAPYAVMAGSAGSLLGNLPATQLIGTIAGGNLPASPNFSGTVTAASFSGSGAGLTSLNATNIVTGAFSTNQMPAAAVFTNDNRVLSLTNTNNSFAAGNFLFNSLFSGAPNWRGRLLWNGSAGLFTSPDDANFNLFINTGHGGAGNGVEWQFQANQVYMGPVTGGHFQFGLSTDFPDTFYVNRALGQTSLHGQSHLIGWHYSWLASTNTSVIGFAKWDMQATNYDNTTGDSLLRFYYCGTDAGEDGQFVNTVPGPIDLDSKGYLLINGATKRKTASTSAGASYAINFAFKDIQTVTLNRATTFTLTNVSLTNFTQTVELYLYPGPFGWPVSFPTNIIWESDSGAAVSPTTAAGSNVTHVILNAVCGATTNIFGRVLLAPYSPPVDPDASAFFASADTSNTVEKSAVNNLVIALKADGSWTNLDAIYPFLGDSANVDSWNLKNTGLYHIAWHGTVSHNANGVAGDGSTGYGDTGFNAGTAGNPAYRLNSAMIGIYCKSPSPTDIGSFLGAVDGSGHRTVIWRSGTFWEGEGINNNNVGTTHLSATGGSFVDQCDSVRMTPTTGAFYTGTAGISGSDTVTGVPTVNFYVLCENNGGPFKFSNANLACVVIGGGMSATQVSNLQADILAFEVALGRQ